ncbi:Nonspecific lipid-transfer protein [Tieghemostelium lacteum]|uniref:Nonspecific lipid-transfer protein n=1 Tax=Tieghemostelium lacteum TaxID=361077 RepID=A0A151ZJJ3_TIELA|nr:Nonspecific lipid-transfer protein [Tieghemostelium lacteum]|eukprot:KYQ94171.1 Nonspecific lipid-transfer protein [Tieghemostelium lacteum]
MSSADFFNQLEAIIKNDGKTLVKKIGGIYQFNITTADGVKEYAVNLKSGDGSFERAKHASPDVTISMKEEDFLDILAGKLSEQTAFMKKKLSIKGNMALAMKFKTITSAVKSAAPAASKPASTTGAATATASTASLDDGTPVGKVFETISKTIAGKPELVKSINGIYQFNIASKVYTVDLKTGKGGVKTGAATPKADCTITIAEENFLPLMSGKVNGQSLFAQGKLKIAGNMGLAMKLSQLTKAIPSPKL